MKRFMKWVIIVSLIIFVFIIYKIIKHVALSSGNSAQKEIKTPVGSFLKPGGTNDECSYSVWFIIDEWTNNEKTLFTKTISGETGSYNPVGTTGETGGVTGTYDFKLLFEVAFDKYVNNLNIFLPELNNSYKKSNNCKITNELLKETESSLKDCRTFCSEYNNDFKTCNSFTFIGGSGSTGSTGVPPTMNGYQSNIYFGAEFNNGVNFEGNQAYDEAMGDSATDSLGKCYLYSSSPVIPKNCFSGMTGKVAPYSVYDWEDFIYSNGIASYVKEKCSIPIPIQKWTNLIITIKKLIMEIYINGKLVKQCYLTSYIDNEKDNSAIFTITPSDYGFNGSTRNFNYWNKCLTSSEIYNLSKKVS